MKTIGSHPGATLFRLALMVILILLFTLIFLHYAGKAEKSIERQSILQTKRVIEAALVVVFATYATRGRLDELAAFDGANPFEFLREYLLLPKTYHGEIAAANASDLASGWHYLTASGELMYLPFYLSEPAYFKVSLSYEDINQNGRYDSRLDRFRALRLIEIKQPR
jgi:hypothetical protein